MKKNKNSTSVFTYQTRLKTNEAQDALLDKHCRHWNSAKHTLHNDIQNQINPNDKDVKREFLFDNNLSSREYNSIKLNLQGTHSSYQANAPRYIEENEGKIKGFETKLKKAQTNLKGYDKHPSNKEERQKIYNTIQFFKRKIHRLQSKNKKYQKDIDRKAMSLSFGGKKLFHEQYNLEDNGLKNHSEWYQKFDVSRNSEFTLVGSKDETSGNQQCQLKINEDGGFYLKLRLNHTLHNQQKFITFPDIQFEYGMDNILASYYSVLEYKTMNKARLKLIEDIMEKEDISRQKASASSEVIKFKREKIDHIRGALTYRFKRDSKGWRVFVSTSVKANKRATDRKKGIVGMDLNADHLALCETDKSGNPINTWSEPLLMNDMNANQRKAYIGDMVEKLMSKVLSTGKPIAIEDLDFKLVKSRLESYNKGYNRMISILPYQQIKNMILASASRKGIEVIIIKPAYTSQIGRYKFMKRYGMTVHHSAALTIARRPCSLNEDPNQSDIGEEKSIPDGKCSSYSIILPERKEVESNWEYWGRVVKGNKKIIKEHFRKVR
jgi:IS605 OrfB family transposase